jgi:hypothetical protein
LAFPKHSLIGWRRQMGASSTSRNFYDIKQLGRVRDADRYWRLDRNVRLGFHLGQEVPIPLLVCIEADNSIKIWALAHLLANGDVGGMLLFGSFLAWAVFDRIAVKKRGDMGAERIASFTRADATALGVGTIAYVAMIFLHPILIGVPVIGR